MEVSEDALLLLEERTWIEAYRGKEKGIRKHVSDSDRIKKEGTHLGQMLYSLELDIKRLSINNITQVFEVYLQIHLQCCLDYYIHS